MSQNDEKIRLQGTRNSIDPFSRYRARITGEVLAFAFAFVTWFRDNYSSAVPGVVVSFYIHLIYYETLEIHRTCREQHNKFPCACHPDLRNVNIVLYLYFLLLNDLPT